MEFKDMKKSIVSVINDNYVGFVKALISVEKGVNNKEELNSLYD
jgi:single-strand binding family protein